MVAGKLLKMAANEGAQGSKEKEARGSERNGSMGFSREYGRRADRVR